MLIAMFPGDWTLLEQGIVGASLGVIVLALLRHLVLTLALKKVRFLTPDSPKIPPESAPLVSIMVPAKDEAHGIEGCLGALLALDYPRYEILVVDDRSEDETAAIVERMARESGRIRLIRITSLPPGWTGKTHALHVCQQQARGEWLLFVDADARLEPECLSVLVHDAIVHEVALESLLPRLTCQSFWERVIQPFAGICLMFFFPLPRVNRPRHADAGFANGQFILISRAAYDAIGGHEGVRDKFVEDIHLGRRVRRQGLGLRVVMAPALVSVRMYSSLRDIVRGWSRIFYSAVDQRPGRLALLGVSICVFSVWSYVNLAAGVAGVVVGSASSFWWTLLALGVVQEGLQSAIMARLYALSKSPMSSLLFRFLAVFLMLYILARTMRMCWTHEVIWRGTTYGKELLEATAEDFNANGGGDGASSRTETTNVV